jgi:hypothetical protein
MLENAELLKNEHNSSQLSAACKGPLTEQWDYLYEVIKILSLHEKSITGCADRFPVRLYWHTLHFLVGNTRQYGHQHCILYHSLQWCTHTQAFKCIKKKTL